MKRFIWALGFLFVLTLLGSGAALAQKRTLLYFGSTSSISSSYAFNIGVAKAINLANPDLTVTVIETGASVDNIKRAGKNKIDIGLSSTSALYQAYNGMGQFKGSPQKDLRLLWCAFPDPMNFVVRADSGIKTLKDLEGKPFSPGIRGSSTENLAMQVFEILNIKPKWVRGGLNEALEAIKDGRLVGYAKSLPSLDKLDASTMDLATFTPVWIVAPKEEEMAAVLKAMPELTKMTISAGIIKGMPEFQSVGSFHSEFVTKNLSLDHAYRIFKAVAEDKVEIEAAYPQIKINFVDNTLKYANTPLHAGVVKYLREKGHQVPDNLVPPEMR